MKKYLSFFRIRFSNGLQYRAAAYAGVVTQLCWGLLYILLYKAFYNANSDAFPMTMQQTASYIWLQQAFLAMFMTWFMDNEIFNSITSGSVAYELARPLDIYNMWFTKSMATKLSRATLRCLPILLISAFLPEPMGMSLPSSFSNFLLFLLTTILGFLTVVAYCMLVYIATFKTLSPMGVRVVSFSLSEFFSGAIIPLPFFPDNIRKILDLTPFASMQNLPFRIYIGNIKSSDVWFYILVQLFWLLLMVVSGKLWMKSTLKKVIIQGG
jgi:ABC-2 type transport system permease protein